MAAFGQDLRERTKQFALRIIRMYASLPKTTAAQVIGKQVLRSGTSIVRTIEKHFVPGRMPNF